MPKVGDWMVVYGQRCQVFKVHALGTVDVVTADGQRAYRVTGLPLLTKADAGHPDNVIL